MSHNIKYSLVHVAAGLILTVILVAGRHWITPLFVITVAAAVVLLALCVVQLARNIKRSKGKD